MRHLSTLQLHQLRYGELPSEREPAARSHLAECPDCARRLAVQGRERRAFEVLPVPPAFRPAAPPRRWWTWSLGGLLLAAAGIAAVVLGDPAAVRTEASTTGLRPKGGQADGLEVWVERENGARPWQIGETLGAGDVVQLVVDPDGARVITLGGQDGTGQVEVYGSFQPDTPQRPSPAPFSLTLDGAPGPQRFLAVRAQRAMTDAEMKAAALSGVTPEGATLIAIAIPKE